jgi:hypothetical protein
MIGTPKESQASNKPSKTVLIIIVLKLRKLRITNNDTIKNEFKGLWVSLNGRALS